MPAAKINLTVEQGSTFTKTFIWKDAKNRPINLAGYTASLQVRAKADESLPILLEIGSQAPESGITLGGTAGTIALEISDEETATLTFTKGSYDLLMTPPSGKRKRLVQGTFTVSPRVTVLA
jgi:hypothetical protein